MILDILSKSQHKALEDLLATNFLVYYYHQGSDYTFGKNKGWQEDYRSLSKIVADDYEFMKDYLKNVKTLSRSSRSSINANVSLVRITLNKWD